MFCADLLGADYCIWLCTKVRSSVWLQKVRIYVNKQNCLTHTPERRRNPVKTCCEKQRASQHQANSLFSGFYLSHTLFLWVSFAVYPLFRSSKSKGVTARWNHSATLLILSGLNKPGHATVPIMMSLFHNLLYPCAWTQNQHSQRAVSQKNMMNIAWLVWRGLLGVIVPAKQLIGMLKFETSNIRLRYSEHAKAHR